MSRQKVNVYEVRFFFQKGALLGGKSESATVTAISEQEATERLKARESAKRPGQEFVLVSVTKTGAQG